MCVRELRGERRADSKQVGSSRAVPMMTVFRSVPVLVYREIVTRGPDILESRGIGLQAGSRRRTFDFRRVDSNVKCFALRVDVVQSLTH